MTGTKTKRVLMVCLGNTCRSPIAEAIFKNHVKNMGNLWEVESAALKDYHIGEMPNQRAMYVLKKHGYNHYEHVARQIQNQDFENFDWIFGMDEYNMKCLNEMKPKNCRAQIELLGKYHPNGELIIEDPYFDNDISSFEKVYEQCVSSIESFLKQKSES